jgi:molecular chaperone IbpA
MTTSLLPSIFDFHKTLDPYTVGFDSFFKDIEEVTKTIQKAVPSYPPYNIKQVSKNKYVIEMAVAGFAKSDIEVTLEGNKLVIKGSAKENDINEEESFLFKGIANRNFTRAFTLADKIEIGQAEMVNGMLKVWLESLVQTQDTIKKIAIKEKKDV